MAPIYDDDERCLDDGHLHDESGKDRCPSLGHGASCAEVFSTMADSCSSAQFRQWRSTISNVRRISSGSLSKTHISTTLAIASREVFPSLTVANDIVVLVPESFVRTGVNLELSIDRLRLRNPVMPVGTGIVLCKICTHLYLPRPLNAE